MILNQIPARAVRLLAGVLFLSAPVLGAAGEALAAAGEALPAAGEALAAELAAPAADVLAAVAERYAAVTNLSCTVRRQLPGSGAEMISRVVFARGGRLSSETLSPERRRVVVDGRFAWTKGKGDKEPRKTAFEDQSATQKASVMCVPASPEETLSALDGASAAELAPPDARFARQIAFAFRDAPPQSGKRAVVSFDEKGRIRAIDVFSDEELKWRLASFGYDAPREVLPGVWLFGRTTAETAIDGTPVKVVSLFDGLKANAEVDESVFDAEKAFGKAPR